MSVSSRRDNRRPPGPCEPESPVGTGDSRNGARLFASRSPDQALPFGWPPHAALVTAHGGAVRRREPQHTLTTIPAQASRACRRLRPGLESAVNGPTGPSSAGPGHDEPSPAGAAPRCASDAAQDPRKPTGGDASSCTASGSIGASVLIITGGIGVFLALQSVPTLRALRAGFFRRPRGLELRHRPGQRRLAAGRHRRGRPDRDLDRLPAGPGHRALHQRVRAAQAPGHPRLRHRPDGRGARRSSTASGVAT